MATSPKTAPDPEALDAGRVDAAVRALGGGDFKRAESLLRDVISRAPSTYEYATEQPGGVFMRFWDQQEFVHYTNWLQQNFQPLYRNRSIFWIPSAYPRAYYYMGFLKIKTQHYHDALVYLEEGYRLEPNAKFRLEMAQALIMLGRHQEALAIYDEVEEPGPFSGLREQSAALRGRGFVLIELGDINQAEETFRESLKLDPESKVALSELEYIAQLREQGQAPKQGQGWWKMWK